MNNQNNSIGIYLILLGAVVIAWSVIITPIMPRMQADQVISSLPELRGRQAEIFNALNMGGQNRKNLQIALGVLIIFPGIILLASKPHRADGNDANSVKKK